jgi:hypothetical protein
MRKEYKRLFCACKTVRLRNPLDYSHLTLMVKNFANSLRIADLAKFCEKIEWLAAQSPKFLLRFFFVYRVRCVPLHTQINILLDDDFIIMKNFLQILIKKKEGNLFVFYKPVCELKPDPKSEFFEQKIKILELADLILCKTADLGKIY